MNQKANSEIFLITENGSFIFNNLPIFFAQLKRLFHSLLANTISARPILFLSRQNEWIDKILASFSEGSKHFHFIAMLMAAHVAIQTTVKIP